MTETTEWREWNLSGLKVTQLRFDYSLHVHLWALERELLVSFGVPFVFRSPDGEERTFDPVEKTRRLDRSSRCSTSLPRFLPCHLPVGASFVSRAEWS